MRINDAGREHGQIRAFSGAALRPRAATCRRSCCATRTTAASRASWPTARRSQLEFNIENRTYPAGKTSYNAIAEIPGTDKADEVVMLGGHLDSWHSATGATDNAIGCAVMMEAARILQAIGVKPRRTIRVALWGGEEQGLLGSKAYVEQHFGTAENPKPEFAKFNGYFNVDGGTGRIRGALDLRAARSRRRFCAQFFRQFEDLGVYGAIGDDQPRRPAAPTARRSTPPACRASASARTRSSTTAHTWHTNLDTYRAHRRGGREEVGGGDRVGGLSRRDARTDAAALRAGQDAGGADAGGGGGGSAGGKSEVTRFRGSEARAGSEGPLTGGAGAAEPAEPTEPPELRNLRPYLSFVFALVSVSTIAITIVAACATPARSTSQLKALSPGCETAHQKFIAACSPIAGQRLPHR